jgi:flavodoxin I
MKVLIIYDSFFGNTELIARAIGSALEPQEDAGVLRVTDVKPEQLTGLELLIVGSPTRAFRPTEAMTNFLKGIANNGLQGVKVASFDTRIATGEIKSPVLRFMVNLGGYAAKPIANKLKKKGGNLIMPPEGFFVKGEKGPLNDGEIERAAEWARQCGRAAK